MAVKADDQLGLDETVVEDATLEKLLEARLRAQQDKAEVTGVFKRANESARAAIATLELEEGSVVRVGRFRIAHQTVKGHSVAFETADSDRIRIDLIEGGDPDVAASDNAAIAKISATPPADEPPADLLPN